MKRMVSLSFLYYLSSSLLCRAGPAVAFVGFGSWNDSPHVVTAPQRLYPSSQSSFRRTLQRPAPLFMSSSQPQPQNQPSQSQSESQSQSQSIAQTHHAQQQSSGEGTHQEEGPAIGYATSCLLSSSDIKPLFTWKEGTPQEKIINAFGMYSILVTLVLNPIWSLAMFLTNCVYQVFPDVDPNRAFYDQTGKLWSKAWLALTNSYPSMSGDVQRFKSATYWKKNMGGSGVGSESESEVETETETETESRGDISTNGGDTRACLYVANHASWLDIPVLCTVLDPVFKFIAKGELENVPCIGQQLKGGKHILIDRQDRRSQLRTFKEGVQWLQKGVPLMAFPEGKRSKDGRLDEFKGGIFSMAVKANVPIVPISISNTHAIMPSNALFPFQSGHGKLHVHVHEPIEVDGRTEEELVLLVREALLSRMPLEQHPIGTREEESVLEQGDADEMDQGMAGMGSNDILQHQRSGSENDNMDATAAKKELQRM